MKVHYLVYHMVIFKPIEDEVLLLITLTLYCASEKKTKDKHKSKHHKGDRLSVSFLISHRDECLMFEVLSICELYIIWILHVPINP